MPERPDRIHRKIDEVFKEIKEGKIKDSNELDKKLSSLNLMRVNLINYKKTRKDILKYHENEIKTLEGKREGYYFGLLGMIIGFLGATFSTSNLMSWLFLFSSIITIGLFVRLLLKTKKDGIYHKLLIHEWYPHVIVEAD